ncbi:MAG: nuclease-related domain-containing protein [Acutalibacteraceae bacterium]|nr:nuclease-related domain-containing protein [Acutalibacteraceae bacterium]
MKEMINSLLELLSNPYFITMILAAVIPKLISRVKYLKRKKEYTDSSYYKITGIQYDSIKKDDGKYGEYLLYKEIKLYETDNGRFLFNLYLPKEDGKTTEIDVVLICTKGIIVFESKNYSGWIFGDEKRPFWTQTLPIGIGDSQKERFYNPIMQNKKHIEYIRKQIARDIPIFSVIVFSDRCTFKKLSVQNDAHKVIYRSELKSTVDNTLSGLSEKMSSNEVKDLYDKLYPFSQVSEEAKMKHIENVKVDVGKN